MNNSLTTFPPCLVRSVELQKGYVGDETYYRVSTDKQGISGLGMDAQKQAVANLDDLLKQAMQTPPPQ